MKLHESLLDDDACRIKVGEVYIQTSNDNAAEYVEKEKKNATAELKEMEQRLAEITGKMDELKVQLYAKFKDSINLEYNEANATDVETYLRK